MTTYPDHHLDPRPDLVDDAAEWTALLATQYARDGNDQQGLFGILLGFRAEGARLVRDRGRLRLEAGELAEEYPALRSVYLVPRRIELSHLLEIVTDRLNGKQAARAMMTAMSDLDATRKAIIIARAEAARCGAAADAVASVPAALRGRLVGTPARHQTLGPKRHQRHATDDRRDGAGPPTNRQQTAHGLITSCQRHHLMSTR